jgi:hypothetical protein
MTGRGYSQQNSSAADKNGKSYNNTKIKSNMVTDTLKAYARSMDSKCIMRFKAQDTL